MRILEISHRADGIGGVQAVADALSSLLRQEGHDVLRIGGGERAQVTDQAVTLPCSFRVERAVGVSFPIPTAEARAELRGLVRGADLVHVHESYYPIGTLAGRFAAEARIPVVVTQHAGLPAVASWTQRIGFHALARFRAAPLLRSANKVLFTSDHVRRYFKERWNVNGLLVPNGVAFERFYPCTSREERRLELDRLGVGAGTTLLFVGRFVERKGLAQIRAMAEARRDWNWILVGDGPERPEDWNLPNVCVRRSARSAEVALAYRVADAFVLPSFGEGFPLVVQEAMASGLPCVVIPQVVDGYPPIAPLVETVEGYETLPWLDAIERTLRRSPERSALAAFARDHWSWNRMLAELRDALAKAA